MARHFPIFIDLGGTPPLVVGAQPALSAKLRLLTGFAPRVELLTGLRKFLQGLAFRVCITLTAYRSTGLPTGSVAVRLS